jgi:hypothetical protein
LEALQWSADFSQAQRSEFQVDRAWDPTTQQCGRFDERCPQSHSSNCEGRW